MLSIPNLPTQDKYVDALTLGPVPGAQVIKYVVANRSVFARIWPQSKSGTIPAPSDELLITPETNVVTNAMGIQFRSAVAGVPAQVIAQLLEQGDPLIGSGTPFSSTISGSGSISPGVSSLQFQLDGALFSTEPALDVLTGLGVKLTGADDAANQRALLTISAAAIADVLLGAPAAFMDFQNISQLYRHLRLITSLRDDSASGLGTSAFRLNNDAAAHYNRIFVNNSGSSTTQGGGTGLTAGFGPILNGSNSQANGFAGGEIRISDYADANIQKIVDAWGGAYDTVGLSQFWQHSISLWTAAVAAVNRVTLFPAGANFVQNARATLYGEA